MIETTIPEINVADLMVRVRAKADELRRIQSRPTLPEIATVAELPPTVLPKPVAPKSEQISAAIKNARAAVNVPRWIPKPLRGLFRRQDKFDREALRVIETFASTNVQVLDRLQHLGACIAVQDHTIRHLAQLRRQDGEWMNAIAQVIIDMHDKILETRAETNNDISSRIEQTSGAIKALEHDVAMLRETGDAVAESQQHLVAELRGALNTATQARDDLARTGEEIRRVAENLLMVSNESHQVRDEAAAIAQRVSAMENDMTQARELLGIVEKNSPTAERMRTLEGDTSADLRALREILDRTGEHLRNLQSQVDREMIQQKRFNELENIVSRLDQRFTEDATYLKAEVAQHRVAIAHPPQPDSTTRRKLKSPQERGLLDAFYVSFEDQFRGARADIKRRLEFYLPLIQNAGAGSAEFPVLDVGCGRGEWLELLQERDFVATGVDLNATMQAQCMERRLDVIHGDVLDHMRDLPDGQLGAVTGFHIIEHLPLEALLELVSHAHRVLKPGGVVIFESPNCKNLVVGACNFHLDPTHRSPIVPETAEFILAGHGFVDLRLNYLWPIKGSPFKSKSAISKLLNDYLFGPQDFSVVGFKTLLK